MPPILPCCCVAQDMEELTEQGWTYPRQGSSTPLSLWTSSHLEMADWSLGRDNGNPNLEKVFEL